MTDLPDNLVTIVFPPFPYFPVTRKSTALIIVDMQKALGATLPIDADTIAGIVVPASQGFWQWAALDPDQAHYYTAFLELLMKALEYQQPTPR